MSLESAQRGKHGGAAWLILAGAPIAALALLLWFWATSSASVGPMPRAATADAAQTASSEAAVPSVDPGVQSADAARGASTRVEVAAPQTIEQRVEQVLALRIGSSGDVGADHTVALLRNIMNDTADARARFRHQAPTAEEWAANREINPLGVDCSAEQLRACQSLIDSYARRISDLRFEQYLTAQIGALDAIARGDFLEIPNGENWSDERRRKDFSSIEQRIGNKRDFNCLNLPGRDFTHNRLVFFTRESNPEFFRAMDAMDLDKAELQVAVRTFFLGLQRR